MALVRFAVVFLMGIGAAFGVYVSGVAHYLARHNPFSFPSSAPGLVLHVTGMSAANGYCERPYEIDNQSARRILVMFSPTGGAVSPYGYPPGYGAPLPQVPHSYNPAPASYTPSAEGTFAVRPVDYTPDGSYDDYDYDDRYDYGADDAYSREDAGSDWAPPAYPGPYAMTPPVQGKAMLDAAQGDEGQPTQYYQPYRAAPVQPGPLPGPLPAPGSYAPQSAIPYAPPLPAPAPQTIPSVGVGTASGAAAIETIIEVGPGEDKIVTPSGQTLDAGAATNGYGATDPMSGFPAVDPAATGAAPCGTPIAIQFHDCDNGGDSCPAGNSAATDAQTGGQ